MARFCPKPLKPLKPLLPKSRVVQKIQQISDYLVSRIKKGYQVTFGGFTVGLSISGKFDAMNAGGKTYALARLKVKVVE